MNIRGRIASFINDMETRGLKVNRLVIGKNEELELINLCDSFVNCRPSTLQQAKYNELEIIVVPEKDYLGVVVV